VVIGKEKIVELTFIVFAYGNLIVFPLRRGAFVVIKVCYATGLGPVELEGPVGADGVILIKT
jgi:hypothetical protein